MRLEEKYHIRVTAHSVRWNAHCKLWEVGSDDLAQEEMASVIGMDAIAAVINRLKGKGVGHKRRPGVDDVRRWIMGDDPVSKRRQINTVSWSLKSMLHGDTVGLELSNQV